MTNRKGILPRLASNALLLFAYLPVAKAGMVFPYLFGEGVKTAGRVKTAFTHGVHARYAASVAIKDLGHIFRQASEKLAGVATSSLRSTCNKSGCCFLLCRFDLEKPL